MPPGRKKTAPELDQADKPVEGPTAEPMNAESNGDEQVEGVLVSPFVTDEGRLDVKLQVLGTTRVTEVETLLGLGLKSVRRNLDLN